MQTVPKRGSAKHRVVMDLSFPCSASVDDGISKTHYLDTAFQLRLPGIDRLRDFIIAKGPGCYVFKKDLKRAYRQFPIDPKDYKFLGFLWDQALYFDTRFPFGLRSSAMICQSTTRAVIYIFTQEGFSADAYLDDFYGAEYPSVAPTAFERLQNLFDELGLQSSPEDNCLPSTQMICLGILVDTVRMVFEVPQDRLLEPHEELLQWSTFADFAKSQLQALLGKLSFVSACVKPGRIFMSRLLNCLRTLQPHRSRFPISSEMLADINWWLTFLPSFNGTALTQLRPSDFQEVLFTCDSSLHRGGATYFDECITFGFPRHIESLALHITALELSALVIAVKLWAPKLAGVQFQISCDNDAAVQIANSGRTQDPFMQRCLRQLWLTKARYDLEIHVIHVPGIHNVFPDCLSRWDMDDSYPRRFHALERQHGVTFHILDLSSEALFFEIS